MKKVIVLCLFFSDPIVLSCFVSSCAVPNAPLEVKVCASRGQVMRVPEASNRHPWASYKPRKGQDCWYRYQSPQQQVGGRAHGQNRRRSCSLARIPSQTNAGHCFPEPPHLL
jgi:hypothetical protein